MRKSSIRKATFTVEEILAWIEEKPRVGLQQMSRASSQRKAWLEGEAVKYNSKRLRVFKLRGTKCAYCGREATYFALEKHPNDGSFHLELYALNKDGSETMFTRDHVVPRSRGGSDKIKNQVPACDTCNRGKADQMPVGRWRPKKNVAVN